MDKLPKSRLKFLYSDLIRGYSCAELDSPLFIKHLNVFDTSEIDVYYEDCFNNARQKELPTTDERLAALEESKLWTEKDEGEIIVQTKFAENLKKTKNQLIKKIDKDQIDIQLKKTLAKVAELEKKRTELIGFTCDLYAQKKANELYIFNSLFKDKGLTERLFEREEFDNLDDDVLSKIVSIYNDIAGNFTAVNLQRIALSSFFLNIFYLCENNPHLFFGKPLINLSYWQVELFGYGRYFKSILSEIKQKLDEETLDNPEKLIEMYNSSKTAENLLDKTQGESVSIVGASRKEMKEMGLRTTNLAAKAKAKGGNLNMEELMSIT